MTYDDLFDLLETFVSWYNYEIFTHLATNFFNGKEIQILWNSYEIEFKEYLSEGKGIMVVPSATIKGLPESVGTKVMIIKVEYADHAWNDYKIFSRALAKALGTSYITLYLCSIDTGCVELRFVIPSFIFGEIFPLNSQQIKALSDLGVTAIAVHCEAYHEQAEVHMYVIYYIY